MGVIAPMLLLWLVAALLLGCVYVAGLTVGEHNARANAQPVVMQLLEERELQRNLRAAATTAYLVEVDAHAETAAQLRRLRGSEVRAFGLHDRAVPITVSRERVQ